MKISNSKKQLAEIISENGGWRDGAEFAAQGGNHGHVGFASVAPVRNGKVWDMTRGFAGKFLADEILPNWHQTILSRDEYFHLYPALGELCGKVTEENRHEPVWTNPPSIEQLAADYRNAKDYADRKQQEADAAKADAEAKLAELVAAGTALGLVLSVAGAEPELVITDWRDLRVGDVIEYVDGRNKNRVGMVGRIDSFDLYNAGTDRPVRMVSDNGQVGWPTKWRFIHRPAKWGADNA